MAFLHRAEPYRPVPPTPEQQEAEGAWQQELLRREARERRRIARGLLLMALIALVFSFRRAGLDRVFVPGWWRQW